MPVVRLEAFRALEERLKSVLPLEVETILIQRPGSKKECNPSLTIMPVRFRYIPDQEENHFVPDAKHLVVNVGRHEGTVQLRIAATSLQQRAELEQAVLDLFLGTEGHPGVLLTTIVSCPALGKVLAAWELEDDEWDSAKAFDNRYESVITLTAIIPALVTRDGVYAVNELHLGLTSDFDTPITPAVFDAGVIVKVVAINPDGSLSPLP